MSCKRASENKRFWLKGIRYLTLNNDEKQSILFRGAVLSTNKLAAEARKPDT